ncbi:50S ribosomal protein L25 [Planctomicrobium sp. SH661]|uniref:50S ribosomal protein L25 n=1 Tax=Planctomicrobium sp. SH661 TaxID=3448124 RepID=UPI003F5C5DA3
MSQIVKLSAKSRDTLGTSSARRLRLQGLVPCNVYGHKQDPRSIAVENESLTGIIRSGARVVDLDVDGKSEKALLKDVQWDTFSVDVVHVDFLRVDMDERVKLEVPLQLKGTAPGVIAGGLMEIHHHVVQIECLAFQVPEFIQVKVGSLNIGDSVHVRDLQELPEGVQILAPADVVLVQVVQPKASPDPLVPAGGEGAEPALVNPPKDKDGAAKS